ncbi:MAG: bifunctional DNA-formamidopyrimidine glycosylase/DNA-(apurinic or apyrimidinic site) lyase [Alphaproteobacteria bacterium]|nr:bifunctional DNA-formamidopyrimidine glycosylase/DNA-(apurinic or apyrimidinic site) lyase [Alphaproteobacteria bacterium]
MPELPEVETVRRGLAPVLEGHVIRRAEARRPDLRVPLPANFAERLTGRRVLAVRRRAKYLLIDLDDGWVWLAHLGMSGRMTIGEGGMLDRHDHVVVETDAGVVVTYRDPRRFGLMDLVPAAALDAHPSLAALGPEPLDDSFTAVALGAMLAGRKGPLKTTLLDQRVVAGLGNIYVCEALFRAGLSPIRAAGTLGGRATTRLWQAIRAVLAEAIEAGGSSLRDHQRPDGELGYFQHGFRVYGREGQPCPDCDCGGGVLRLAQAGRSTFYCAKRQR